MNTIFSKLRDFVGLNEAEEYEYYDEEMDNTDYQNVYPEEAPAPTVEEQRPNRRRTRERPTLNTETDMASSAPRNNVIGMPGTAGLSEVVVVEPRTFEEMPQVIQALRERKSVVLNLTTIDPDEAQRAVDFVAGGTYAIDGHQERIGESIFLFTPSCVQVTTQSGTMNEVTQAPAAPMRQGPMPMQTPAAWGMEQDLMAQ